MGEVEAKATSRALKFGLEFGIHWAILEGDSEVVLKAMENEESGQWLMGYYLRMLAVGEINTLGSFLE